MRKIDPLLNLTCALLLPVLIGSSACADPLSASALPRNFNPNTCEEDQKTVTRGYGASCDALRVIYHWLPVQQAILDAHNALPPEEDRLDKFGRKDRFLGNLAALADLTKRIGFEYKRPPQEKTDWLGNYLNRSQRIFDLNQLPVPKTIDDVFTSLHERAAKDYVTPEDCRRA